VSKQPSFPLDAKGLPGSTQRDGSVGGGDTASMVGIILALSKDKVLVQHLLNSLPLLLKDGIPVRTWQDKPEGSKLRFSRDQLVPMICAGIVHGRHPVLDAIFKSHLRRLLLVAWNWNANGEEVKWRLPDLTLLQVWGLWLRYKRPTGMRLLLWFCDLEHFVGTLLWRYKVFMEDEATAKKYRVTQNHMLLGIVCNTYDSTFISRLSHKMTPYKALNERWSGHCIDQKEYYTADLFEPWT
jgi:hypothetical protein